MSRARQLAALHYEMRTCRRCMEAGHSITPGAIFSGNLPADIMLIGQAPGVTEVEAGRPFNAGSGSRLFDWLAGAGLDEDSFRRNQYMTSVTKCFPGKATNGGGDRVPSKAEQDLCRPFLDRELALVDPKIILPVGRLAIDLFFSASKPLTGLIGTERQIDGRWVIPLPHPSGASRWHQLAANRARIEQAVALIEMRLRQL